MMNRTMVRSCTTKSRRLAAHASVELIVPHIELFVSTE